MRTHDNAVHWDHDGTCVLILSGCGGPNRGRSRRARLPASPSPIYQIETGRRPITTSTRDGHGAEPGGIRPEVSGYITDIYFRDGQQVRKGKKLYAIDQQQYRAAYDQAVANLNVAQGKSRKAAAGRRQVQRAGKEGRGRPADT